jgi:hypothetical protein
LKREKISNEAGKLCYRESFLWLHLAGIPSSEEEECSVSIDKRECK